MEVTRTLRPGKPGTIKFSNHYGDQLVAVRYRLDRASNKQYTTIELIVDEREAPLPNVNRAAYLNHKKREPVAIRVPFGEVELRQQVKTAGGYWDSRQKVWWLRYERVVVMRLKDRAVKGLVCPDLDVYPAYVNTNR